MKKILVLFAGGCMITGYQLPPTCALPVLVQRYFRNNNHYNLHCISDSKSIGPGELYSKLEELLEYEKYDFTIIQFFNNQLIPSLDMSRKIKENGVIHSIYKFSKTLEDRILPLKWKTFIRMKLLGIRSRSSYITELERCLEHIKSKNPETSVLLMTPVAPTSNQLKYIRKVFEAHKMSIFKLAEKYNAHVVDIYHPLGEYQPEEVYMTDGYHLTSLGQRITAKTICQTLESILSNT